MTTDAVTLFLALLAVGAQLTVLAAVLVWLAARRAAAARRWLDAFVDAVGPQAVTLAFVVAAVATVGSLYLSEVAHFTPCTLCWYQRIAMYPIAVVLLVATIRRDRAVWPYGVTLALVGLPISIYHVLVENFPSLESSDVCDPTNPCNIIWVDRFGFETIPTMAGSAFALILVLLLAGRSWSARPSSGAAA